MIAELENLPDVSFIDGMTLTKLEDMMVEAYEWKYEEITGSSITLDRADPMTLLIYACAVAIFQEFLYVDRGGKVNLLKYAYGDFLDHAGAFKGIVRLPAAPATVTLRFYISEVQASATSIPAGTRATPDGSIYFETNEYAEIRAGQEYVDVLATCATDGTIGNGYRPGQINILSDPTPCIEEVTNIDASSGGTEIESDDDMRERIYLAPSRYSVAGPHDAYIYWIKAFNSSIADAEITSDEDAVVQIRFIMDGGELPEASVITGLQNYLEDEEIRPLTDQVVVSAPAVQAFSIDMTYYINSSDSAKAVTIQSQVAEAVTEFIKWQSGKIGRDVNPSELTRRVIAAGAKRVEITAPMFAVVPAGTVAKPTSQAVTYGGLEND